MSDKSNNSESAADVLGFRAKIGVLVPSTNTVVQPEFESVTPLGVTNHTARIPSRRRPTHSDEAYREAMREGAVGTEDVIDRVVPLAPDLILLGHSIDSFQGGVDGAVSLQSRLSEHAGVANVLVPSLALKQALEVLGVQEGRLSVLTPYLPPGGEQAASFLEDAGFKVVKVKNLSCPTPLSIAAVTEAENRSNIAELNNDKVDAVVQVGTNMPFQRIAAEAEMFLGKPVLSINTATYWYGLRYLGIEDQFGTYGDLFEKH